MSSIHPVPSMWRESRQRARSLVSRLLPRRTSSSDGEHRERQQRLLQMHGPAEVRAALLALIATPDNRRELRAWRDEVSDTPNAKQILQDIVDLPVGARVPWFELFAERAARAPMLKRQGLAEAARRVMRADGRVRAQDRLMWLALRCRLGEALPPSSALVVDNDLARLELPQVQAISLVTAFLSRLVPVVEGDNTPVDVVVDAPDVAANDAANSAAQAAIGDDASAEPLGALWYQRVMARWAPGVSVVPRGSTTDPDAMIRALRTIQALPWMIRPVLVRAWFDAAVEVGEAPALQTTAADTLRLMCLLLDSPMPEDLASRFIEPHRK